MADLADQIDDYICSFEGVGDLTMDTLAMLIFAWAVIALFILWLCKWLYQKYVKKQPVVDGSATGVLTPTGLNKSGLLTPTDSIDKLRKSEPRDIIGSKEIKDLASKPLGRSLKATGKSSSGFIGSNGNSGNSSGGIVPSTPPAMRKRLSRKSPGPELRKSRSIQPPSNVVGPETISVTWTSQIFRWLYSDLVIVNELLQTWVHALNDSMQKSVEDHGVAVEIVRVLPESPPPNLTNIFCNSTETHPSDCTITWDCECMPVLQVKTFRQKSGKVETSHYRVTISRFRGRLTTHINYNTLKGEMKTEGYPDVRLAMNSIGPIKGTTQDETQLQEVIVEILTNALRSTIYPIDFSIYSTCPRAIEMEPQDTQNNYAMHYDGMNSMDGMNASRNLTLPVKSVMSSRRLLVKVVKGESLSRANDPYCVVEMDEPPQKNQTGARQGTEPYWDEHFLFELSPQSAEILFEVYDRPLAANASPKFLGLGLVGIDELAIGPSSSQILSLQPRPYETEKVTGAITVEFVFIEGTEMPANGRRPYKLKEALKINTHSPTFNDSLQNGVDLADTAIKAITGGALATNSNNPSKSTLIIHSVQRQPSQQNNIRVALNESGQIELHESNDTDESKVETDVKEPEQSPVLEAGIGVDDNVYQMIEGDVGGRLEEEFVKQQRHILQSPTDSFDVSESFSTSAIVHASNGTDDLNNESNHYTGNGDSSFNEITQPGEPMAHSSPQRFSNGKFSPRSANSTMPTSPTDNLPPGTTIEDLERGRSRKKRDFFGTLKKRLGRSKTRAKSADRGLIPIDLNNSRTTNGTEQTRSISADRGVMSGMTNSNSSTLPRLHVPTLDQSRRSSLSEQSGISGLSSASNKTYIHEASTLVLETLENGVKRHFLVPLAIAQRPRWRRKGTKLHIYNDHTFVAKHLSGGLLCDVCNRSIPRRPGKQGYECRDCQVKCHKQCHVRAPQSCPNPTVLSIELSKLNSAAADRSIRKI